MIIDFLLTLIYCFLTLNIVSNLLEVRKQKLIRIIIGILLLTIFNIFIFEITLLNTIKPLINILSLFIISWLVFKDNYKKTLISTFLIYLAFIFLEVILVMFFTILGFEINSFSYFQSIIFSIFICILTKLLFNMHYFIELKKMLLSNEKVAKLIITFLVVLTIPNLIINLYNKLNSKIILIFICFLTLIITILILLVIINNLRSKKALDEYNNLLQYIKTYERIIEERAKTQHEYKNQLVLIKSMIKDNNAIKYIDELLKDEPKHVYDATEINKIPNGGIRGLIYYKCANAYTKDINIKVDVGIIKSLKVERIKERDLIDLTKMLGVFIDNAIDAVLNLQHKDISISIFINDDNKLVISIANNFDSAINIEKILKKKHTTKGKGHGYGLILVSDIVRRNKRIENKTEYISNVFIQNIYYDLKDL